MSEEQLKAFLEAVKADAGLQEKVNGAGDDADAVVAIAKAAGFVISAEELARAQAEISEDELADVTGGSTPLEALASSSFIGTKKMHPTIRPTYTDTFKHTQP